MTAYLVLTRPDALQGDSEKSLLTLPIFVPDRFSFWAFLFPPLWFLWHRLWRSAAIFLLFLLGVQMVGMLLSLPPFAMILMGGGGAFLLGLESGHLRASALQRHGWRLEDVVFASSETESALRFFARHPAAEWTLRTAGDGALESEEDPSRQGKNTARELPVKVLGLFPSPEKQDL